MSDKSYLIGSTDSVDDNPGFRILTYLVDNYTSQWLSLPNEQRFIPPKFVGVALHSTGEGRARAIWQAPGGTTQPAAVAGEQALIRVLDARLPISPGINFSQTVPVKIPNVATFEAQTALIAPGIGAVLQDTGPVAAGSYAIMARIITVSGGAGVNATLQLEWRDAANAVTKAPTPIVLSQDAPAAADVSRDGWIYLERLDLLVNERIRIVEGTGLVAWASNVRSYLCLRPLG